MKWLNLKPTKGMCTYVFQDSSQADPSQILTKDEVRDSIFIEKCNVNFIKHTLCSHLSKKQFKQCPDC